MRETNLTLIRKINKFYDDLLKISAHHFDLSLTDIKVCSFLMNHPRLNSAKHIVEYRMLPKSNVSTSIDKLVNDGYLTKINDENDHRKYLLYLTDKAKPLCREIKEVNDYFYQILYGNIDHDLLEIQNRINQQIILNIDNARKEKEHGKER